MILIGLEDDMGRKKAGGPKPMIGIRMGPDEIRELDQVAQELKDRTGAIEPNRAAVFRLGINLVKHKKDQPEPTSLPHYGDIPCGRPATLDGQPSAVMIDLAGLFRGPNRYLLTARGDSMVNNQISDGDYLVIARQDTADHGSTVVAIVDGEVTLKIYHVRKDGKKAEHWLMPASDNHKPTLIKPGSDAKVIGVLVGVIRKC